MSRAVHPHFRKVVETYLTPAGFEIIELPVNAEGRTEIGPLVDDKSLAGVAFQTPNFFGVVEDIASAAAASHDIGALMIASFTEPLTFGLYSNPGSLGADIVCGEGQSMGIAQSFGGPGLGMFGCKQQYMRNMPGRLVGETKDIEGKRGFVLTLATREQHIRREKATSNICSNQGICAMTAAMYMAALGGTGLRQLAKRNYDKAHYFKSGLQKAGMDIPFSSPVFNEFVVRLDMDFELVRTKLEEEGIVAGMNIEEFYPELGDAYLFCITETAPRKILDRIIQEVHQ